MERERACVVGIGCAVREGTALSHRDAAVLLLFLSLSLSRALVASSLATVVSAQHEQAGKRGRRKKPKCARGKRNTRQHDGHAGRTKRSHTGGAHDKRAQTLAINIECHRFSATSQDLKVMSWIILYKLCSLCCVLSTFNIVSHRGAAMIIFCSQHLQHVFIAYSSFVRRFCCPTPFSPSLAFDLRCLTLSP